MRFADLDAVTLDAFGTLIALTDPVPALVKSLRERGIDVTEERVAEGFAAEGEYYLPRSLQGRDEDSLARLRLECTGVFLDAAAIDLGPAEFVDAYIESLRFELVPGAAEAVVSLRRRGLALAVVSNWDMALAGHLSELELTDLPVVTSAATERALELLLEAASGK